MKGYGAVVIPVMVCTSACNPADVTDSETTESTHATIRSIEDFLQRQGTLCVGPGADECIENGTDCFLFVPPAPNFLGWTNDTDTNNDGVHERALLFAGIDYAGLADAYTPNNLPELSGTITERPLPDGRAQVEILLHTKGANAWVTELDLTRNILEQIASRPTIFGHRPRDVQMGAEQALADTTLHVKLINTAPGAPLPDLVRFTIPCIPEGVELEAIQFTAGATGPLTAEFGVPEGTPGRCTVIQTGLFHPPVEGGVAGDGFPAESIDCHVVGH